MSHTIWGSFDGALTQYIRPYIEVSWTQNVANNTSTVTADLYFHRYTNNYWSYNELTNSNGHSSTFRVGNSTLTQIRPFNLQNEDPPNRVLVWSRTQTITHNADGTASVNISASGNTNVNPQHYSFGETVTLPQIPRQTTINSVSIGGSLSPSTSQTVTVSVDRKHSSYKMDYAIYAGSTRIRNLTNQNVLTSISLTGTQVNNIINTMSGVTSRDLELRVTTKDSNGNQIGTPESQNFNVSLNNSNTRPSFSSIQTSVAGSGHDNSIGMFVQSISRLYASFVVNAGYGASIRSRSISIDGQSFGSQHSTTPTRYDGNSAVLTNSGSRTVTFSATNSRNQSYSVTRTISVNAYRTPRIVNFNGVRRESTPTTVNLMRHVEWNTLSGNNSLTLAVSRKQSSSTSWTNLPSETDTSSPVTTNVVSTGNAETIAYDFRMQVTDQFGNRATSTITVPSAKVLLHYLRDDSIGIGRYSQNEAELEVGGDAIVDGDIEVRGRGIRFNGAYGSGQIYHHATIGNMWIDSPTDASLYLRANQAGGGNLYLRGDTVYVRDQSSTEDTPIVESGSNSNGRYTKFYDGTMICYGEWSGFSVDRDYSGVLYRTNNTVKYYAEPFIEAPSLTLNTNSISSWATNGAVLNNRANVAAFSVLSDETVNIIYQAIGRWK